MMGGLVGSKRLNRVSELLEGEIWWRAGRWLLAGDDVIDGFYPAPACRAMYGKEDIVLQPRYGRDCLY